MSDVEQVEAGVTTMQAAVVAEGRPLRVETVGPPGPGPGPGAVHGPACGLCGLGLDTRRSRALPGGPG